MAQDIFEQLADWDVPPPPDKFDQQLHERVNKSLLVVQLVDLAVRAMPWAMLHFGRAVVGLLLLTLRGHFVSDSPDQR